MKSLPPVKSMLRKAFKCLSFKTFLPGRSYAAPSRPSLLDWLHS